MCNNSIINLTLNFTEIRRRSTLLWQALPAQHYFWAPDAQAMHCLQMVRHVLEGEHLFAKIVENLGNLGNYQSPWQNLPYTNVANELQFAAPYRAAFLQQLQSFTQADLETVEIIRTEKNQRRKLNDYLNRIAYHEAVHTGQLLSYFRTLRIPMPQIWD